MLPQGGLNKKDVVKGGHRQITCHQLVTHEDNSCHTPPRIDRTFSYKRVPISHT